MRRNIYEHYCFFGYRQLNYKRNYRFRHEPAAVFLVVDLLVPGTTNIVSNVAGLVNSFIGQGLVGLIALIIFVAIFNRE